MTTINTNLRSEPFIRKALEKLGFQVEEDQKVPYYYGQPKQSSLVFGAGTATDHESGIAYRCGLNYEDTGREADNGYTFMTDYWGMDCSKEGQEVLDRLGCERVNPSDPNSAHWKWERGGHVGVSGPKKLQQVYVGEVVQYASQYQGRRLTTIEMPNGDVRHEQRGGDLGNQVVVVTALKDGSVKIHVEGGDGESCLVATKFLEDILGTFASREMLPESQRAGVQAAARASA
jgi:hypothetical protein